MRPRSPRSISTLLAAAPTALVIGGGTTGAVVATAPGAHAATALSATVAHRGGIQPNSHCFKLPCLR